MNNRLILASAILLALPMAASAQGVDAQAKQRLLGGISGAKTAEDPVAEARRALVAATDKSPLSMPVALFVPAKAGGFGMYEPRPNAIFKPGEMLHFYVEPQGYKFRTAGETIAFGVTMDIALKSPSGDVLFSKPGFLDQDFVSHHANEELMLNGDLSIDGAKPGAYVMELTLHDKMATATATVKLPFTIQ